MPSGRPRDPQVEDRILSTAFRQLSEEGYGRMSLDAVAVEAKVSKPTIYRRWASKADLATAAIRRLQVSEPPVNAGSSKHTLQGIMQNFRKSLLRPNGMSLVGTVLAEERHTPELLALFRRRLVEPRRRMLREVLERAKAAGELRRDADLDAAVNMLVGALYARYLASSRIPTGWGDVLVDIVWEGVAVRRESGQSR